MADNSNNEDVQFLAEAIKKRIKGLNANKEFSFKISKVKEKEIWSLVARKKIDHKESIYLPAIQIACDTIEHAAKILNSDYKPTTFIIECHIPFANFTPEEENQLTTILSCTHPEEITPIIEHKYHRIISDLKKFKGIIRLPQYAKKLEITQNGAINDYHVIDDHESKIATIPLSNTGINISVTNQNLIEKITPITSPINKPDTDKDEPLNK